MPGVMCSICSVTHSAFAAGFLTASNPHVTPAGQAQVVLTETLANWHLIHIKVVKLLSWSPSSTRKCCTFSVQSGSWESSVYYCGQQIEQAYMTQSYLWCFRTMLFRTYIGFFCLTAIIIGVLQQKRTACSFRVQMGNCCHAVPHYLRSRAPKNLTHLNIRIDGCNFPKQCCQSCPTLPSDSWSG